MFYFPKKIIIQIQILVFTGPDLTAFLSEDLSDAVHNGLLITGSNFLLLHASFVESNRLRNPLMEILAESFHKFFKLVMDFRELRTEQTLPDEVVDDAVEENLVNDLLPVLLAERHAHQVVVGQLVPLHDLVTNLVTQFSCQVCEVVFISH